MYMTLKHFWFKDRKFELNKTIGLNELDEAEAERLEKRGFVRKVFGAGVTEPPEETDVEDASVEKNKTARGKK